MKEPSNTLNFEVVGFCSEDVSFPLKPNIQIGWEVTIDDLSEDDGMAHSKGQIFVHKINENSFNPDWQLYNIVNILNALIDILFNWLLLLPLYMCQPHIIPRISCFDSRKLKRTHEAT